MENTRNLKHSFLSEDYPVILEGSLTFPCEQYALVGSQFNGKK